MTLDELESDFMVRQKRAGTRLVILAVQLDEQDVRALRPVLETHGVSLSERVKELIQSELPSRHHRQAA
jgi:hypothetical protein